MWTLISQGPITTQPSLLIWPHIGSQEAFQALPRAGPSWCATWKVVFLWFSLNEESEAQREKIADCAGRGEVRIHPSRSLLSSFPLYFWGSFVGHHFSPVSGEFFVSHLQNLAHLDLYLHSDRAATLSSNLYALSGAQWYTSLYCVFTSDGVISNVQVKYTFALSLVSIDYHSFEAR